MKISARANITLIAATPEPFALYVSHLQDDGYVVSLAANVGEASVQGETLCPDLVFLDLGESSQAGLGMLRELKAHNCLGVVPLVMLASFDALADVRVGLKLGAADYIIKTETSARALARAVSSWVRLDGHPQARLQESAGAAVAFGVPS